MHDRLVNEVAMGKRFALIIGCTLASTDAFRLGLGISFTAHSPALPAVAPYLSLSQRIRRRSRPVVARLCRVSW
jgi:hypothetical protein